MVGVILKPKALTCGMFVRSIVWSFVRVLVRSFVCWILRWMVPLFVRLFVCSFVRLPIRSLVRSFVGPFFFFFDLLSLYIDANIFRHSRKEVVNEIEKSKVGPNGNENGATEGPWTSVLGSPGGGWTSLFGFFGSHVTRQCPPG